MQIVIDHKTYTIDQISDIVRRSLGSVTGIPKAGPYHPQLDMLVERCIQAELRGSSHTNPIFLKMLKGALLKTTKAHEILTTTGDVAQAIAALEASMSYVEGEPS